MERYDFEKIFDRIKGNELDATNIDFELQAKKGDKIVCFSLFRKLKELVISHAATKYPFDMQFRLRYSFFEGQQHHVIKSNLKIADKWLISLDRVTVNFV